MFKFKMRVVEEDPEGYYYVRWDRATPISVIAENKKDAYKQCWEVMGDSPRGWTWTAHIDSIEAHVPEAATKEKNK